MAQKNCCWCGRPYEDSTGSTECFACTREINERMAPALLSDMQAVYEGHPPQTESQRNLSRLFREKPGEFVDRLHKLEREHKNRVKGLAEKRFAEIKAEILAEAAKSTSHSEVAAADEGSERVAEQLRRLLGEGFEQWLKEKGQSSS